MSIKEYISSIGGSTVLLEKVKQIKKLGDAICPEKIEDFFICEYRKSNSERVYQSLFLFSNKYMLESKNIISAETNIDITFHFEYIDYYEITSNEYNFSKASEKSTLKLEGAIGNVMFLLNASGENCDKLWNIIDKHIKPNLYSELEFNEIVEE